MEPDQIARIRSFGRAVAVEVGALEDSLLDRGRPLGAARVLNAIGLGHQNVSDVRNLLKLDTGLLVYCIYGWLFSSGVAVRGYTRFAGWFEGVFAVIFGVMCASLLWAGSGSSQLIPFSDRSNRSTSDHFSPDQPKSVWSNRNPPLASDKTQQ